MRATTDSSHRRQRPIHPPTALERTVDPNPPLPIDVRSLTLPERHAARHRLRAEQAFWLGRLRLLAEPPMPADDFPAFLLEAPAFAPLAGRIRTAHGRRDLPTGVADELDHFVVAYRNYLRSCADEDVFRPGTRHAG